MDYTYKELEQNLKRFAETEQGNVISIDEQEKVLDVFLFNIDPQNYAELIKEIERINFEGKIKLICYLPDNRIDTFLRVMEETR